MIERTPPPSRGGMPIKNPEEEDPLEEFVPSVSRRVSSSSSSDFLIREHRK